MMLDVRMQSQQNKCSMYEYDIKHMQGSTLLRLHLSNNASTPELSPSILCDHCTARGRAAPTLLARSRHMLQSSWSSTSDNKVSHGTRSTQTLEVCDTTIHLKGDFLTWLVALNEGL